MLAKPKPWSKPKQKITPILLIFMLFLNKFSTPIQIIDAAIIASTITGEIVTYPKPPNIKVILCAIVKVVTWINKGLSLCEKKNNPSTNSIWSNPYGIIWSIPFQMPDINKFGKLVVCFIISIWFPGLIHCDWGFCVSVSILEKFLKIKGPNIFFALKVIGVSINLISVLR